MKTIGLIGSIFLIGYTIGTIGFGFLADRIGRRDALGWSIIIYGLTTALGGISTNLYIFTFLRFLTGIGGAGELAVGAPYTAEMWPKKVRAIGTGGIMFSLYSAGYILAAACALGVWWFGPDLLIHLFSLLGLEVRRSDTTWLVVMTVGLCGLVLVPALGIAFVQAIIWVKAHRICLRVARRPELAALLASVRPALTILDATRVVVRNGPAGRGARDVERRDAVAACRDPLAVEAWGARLFGIEPRDLPHIGLAERMGLGSADLECRSVEV